MTPSPRYILILALLFTSGCATVIEGRSQPITVKSEPEGAQCLIKQADDVVGRITTPGTARIQKSKNDLVILCSKQGYETVSIKNRSDLAITSLANMALYDFSFVGNAVDSLSGANNKYDSDVFIKLARAEAPAAFPAPPGALPVIKLAPEIAATMSLQAPMPSAPVIPVSVQEIASPASEAATKSAVAPVLFSTNPAIHAAASLGMTAHKLQAELQLPSYAQQVADAARRPPFEVTQ